MMVSLVSNGIERRGTARGSRTAAPAGAGRTVELVRLEPAAAAAMLATERFERQRKISEIKVARMVRAIERGHFPLTLIYRAVLPDGRAFVLDGSHRLTAITDAEQGLEVVLVTEALPDEAALGERYGWFDLGAAQRSMADLLRAQGEADLGQWTRIVWRAVQLIDEGLRPMTRKDPVWQRRQMESADPDYAGRLMQPWLPAAREYAQLVGTARRGRGRTLARKGVTAVALVTLADDPERAGRFWRDVTGGTTDPASPVAALFQAAARIETSRGRGGGKDTLRLAAATAAAWRAHREGRELAEIKLPREIERVVIDGTRFA